MSVKQTLWDELVMNVSFSITVSVVVQVAVHVTVSHSTHSVHNVTKMVYAGRKISNVNCSLKYRCANLCKFNAYLSEILIKELHYMCFSFHSS